jgi:hypothetical protein
MYLEKSTINNLQSESHLQYNIYNTKNKMMKIKNNKMAYNGLINNTDIDIYSGEDALQTEYIEDTQ